MARPSRRSKRAWLLLLESDAWRLAPPDDGEVPPRLEFPPELMGEQATAIHAALVAGGWRGAPLVIGLSANLCLAATVDVPAPTMLRKRQAMRFHLEGWIPWSAEDFVADWAPHKNSALMVATRIEPLRELLTRLEQCDASPVALVPTAFLALDRHLADRDVPQGHALLWKHDGGAELFVIRDGRPLAWRHANTLSTEEFLQFCSIDSLQQSVESTWVARGFEPSEIADLQDEGLEITAAAEISWEEALRQSVDAIAAGEREPLVDLRRDELAGERPVQAVAPQRRRLTAAAVVAGLAVCGALWLRGDQYAAASMDVQRRLTATFESTFPQEPPPPRILPAIRQAHALLQGTRGPVKELPTGLSSDHVLERVLAALPSDLRYRVPEIRIEGSSIYLGGEVRSNSDADRIAVVLRAAGFEVDSPRTQRLAEQGFAVRLAGQIVPATQENAVK